MKHSIMLKHSEVSYTLLTNYNACIPQATQVQQARKRFLSNPYILLSISLLWLLNVSIFAEIPITPASPPERNDGR